MPAARLNDRVTFQRRVIDPDGYGNEGGDLVNLFCAWADMLETPGREGLAAGRVEASRTATVRIRRSPESLDLTAADTMLARCETWAIISIGNVARDRALLELVCQTGVAV